MNQHGDHSPSDGVPPRTASDGRDFSETYVEISQRLEKAVAAVCPRWLADRREDLVQVALLRVMDLARKSEGKREFSSSYLWRVAHSALIDEIRRQRRRQEISLDDDEPGGFDFATSHEADPEQDASGREVGDGIRHCLTQMVQNRRLAVTLYLQGHSVPESAEILGWTLKKTENLVYRGLTDLRDCLSSMGLEP